MAAVLTIDTWNGAAPLASTALLGLRFRAEDTPLLDTTAPVNLPAPAVPLNLTQTVTAQGTAQTVMVNNSASLQSGQTVLISPGQATQEAVMLTAVPNAASITAIFGRNHVLGVPFALVTASYPKILQARIVARPMAAVSKLRFFRRKPMPTGIFDQYRLLNSYTQPASPSWISDGTNLFSPVPFTREEIFAPGPFVSVGSIWPMVAIQWLYTAGASSPLDSTSYRFAFDES